MFPSEDTPNKNILYLCPSAPKGACQWNGKGLRDVLEHFRTSHKDLLMDSNTIKADITRDSEQNRIMASVKGLFLVQTEVRLNTGKLLIRLRFLRYSDEDEGEKSSLGVSYGVEVASGKFGFRNETNSEGYSPVYNCDEGVEVDFQAIALMDVVNNVQFLTLSINVNGEDEEEATNSSEYEEDVLEETGAVEYSEDLTSSTTSHDKLELGNMGELNNVGELKNADELKNANELKSANELKIADELTNVDELLVKEVVMFEQLEIVQELKAADVPNVEELQKEEELRDRKENAFSAPDSALKCTGCNQNMIPPIYMCPEGHSVCYRCKGNSCETCGQRITGLRNIDLEEYSKSLSYPCKYAAQGCREKLKYDQIIRHETNCDHCLYRCELCSFQGKVADVRAHFRVYHPSTKIYTVMTDIPFPKGSNFVIINSNGVFHCTSRATETYVEWQVVFCGPKERYFSCEVRLSGKRQHRSTKEYFLNRINESVFRWTAPFDELKNCNVKQKYTKLFIYCHPRL